MSTEAKSGSLAVTAAVPRRSPLGHGLVALLAIIGRELAGSARHYRSSVANVLVGIVVFIAVSDGFDGFRRALTEPYGTYVAFTDYLVPGLVGLVVMLAGARAATSMVDGRGSESIQFLVAAPLSGWFVVFSQLLGISLVATVQAALFVIAALLLGANDGVASWLVAIPAVLLGSFAVSAAITALAVFARPARSLSSVLLYVVVPAFFVSTALYPLWRLGDADAAWLEAVASANPFTHVVELVRYAAEGQFATTSFLVVAAVAAVAFLLVVIGVDPKRRILAWRRTGGWASQRD